MKAAVLKSDFILPGKYYTVNYRHKDEDLVSA